MTQKFGRMGRLRARLRLNPRATFFWVMGAATFAGVGAIYVSVNLEGNLVGWSVLLDVLKDIGVALVVAVVTAVSIELFVNARVRYEIAHEVFQATFRKFVPDPIYMQLRDSVLESDIIRRHWEMHVEVLEPAKHSEAYAAARELHGSDIHLVLCTIAYFVENLTTTLRLKRIEGGIDPDMPIPELGIPRFTSVLIGTYTPKNELMGADDDGQAAGLLTGQLPELRRSGLVIRMDHGELIFQGNGLIPPRTKRSGDEDEGAQLFVRYQFMRTLKVPGMIVQAISAPTDGFMVRVSPTPDISFDVTALHPNMDDVKQICEHEWRFRRGVLPWQGFIIRANTAPNRAVAAR